MDLTEEASKYTTNIQNCYNRGKLISTRILDSPHTGGICGVVMRGEEVIIDNCYNIGDIEVNEIWNDTKIGIGGILGGIGNWSTQSYAIISNSYSIGSMGCSILEGVYLGKILGADLGNGRRNFSNLYYLNTLIGGSNIHGGVAKTEEQLKGLDETLGESFTKDSNNVNKGYPILKWENK